MADSKVFSIEQSLKELEVDIKTLTSEIETKAKTALQVLAMQAHAKIVEKTSVLRSTRSTYIDNLGMTNEGDDIYVVYLKKGAQWIEDGIPQGEMIDRILNGGKPAKVSAEGHRYKTIPFNHGKSSNNMSLAQQRIASYAKTELKKMGLDKVITGSNGKPVIGRAATVNLTGPKAPTSKFNKPLLAGLTVYQREVKIQSGEKAGQTKIKRDIFTFRTVSESQKGSGMWFHNGMMGKFFFDEVAKEIDGMWAKMIAEIVDAAVKSIGSNP